MTGLKEQENISNLLNKGEVFGLGFNDKGEHILKTGEINQNTSACYTPCYVPCKASPGPCICYSRTYQEK